MLLEGTAHGAGKGIRDEGMLKVGSSNTRPLPGSSCHRQERRGLDKLGTLVRGGRAGWGGGSER